MEIVNLTEHPVVLYRMDHAVWIEDKQEWYLPEIHLLADTLAVLPPYRFSTRPYVSGSFNIPVGNGLFLIETLKSAPGNLPAPQEGVYYLVTRETIVPHDRTDFLVGGNVARGYDGEFLGYLSLQQHKV